MVHTRGQGARPEGFSEYQPTKRERKPRDLGHAASMASLIVSRYPHSELSAPRCFTVDPSSLTEAETSGPFPQRKPQYRDASTQTDAELTCKCQLEPASAKRRRDPDESTDQNASKRRKAVTPEQPKFLFSKTRNRSLLTSAPPKLSSRHESPFFHRAFEPTSPESSPTIHEKRPKLRERPSPQQPKTPAPTPTPVGILGSVRKFLGYLTGSGTQGPAENETQQQTPQQSSQGGPDQDQDPDQAQDRDTTVTEQEEFSEQGSPTPTPRITLHEPESPAHNSPAVDSRILTREYFKKRRTANTIAGREQLAAMADSTESKAADFNPTDTPGTNKRKLASVEGHIPGPKSGGFGIDDSYLDMENEVEGIGESSLAEAQPATPATKLPPQTPLRSAMRQVGTNLGSVGRSVKSVRINPVDSVKAVYGQYGRSGDYRGSTFADLSSQSPDSSSSLPFDVDHIHSPTTMQNTRGNGTFRFHLDPNVTDPNDDTWRPSLANPRPGHFRVPDADEFEDEEEDDTFTPHHATSPEEVPPQPSTPRMSHAELPQSTPFEQSGFTGHTDSIMVNETQELRLNKARSDAQKYKPAKSSRLSLSEQARSRSSSPPASETEFTEPQLGPGTPTAEKYAGRQFHETPVPASKRPTVTRLMSREELDNTVIGEDGMTEYGREHQYDSWAEDLLNGANAPSPQTYVEAGIASSYVESLVQKTWTERDTRESIEFWEKEFEEGLKAAREASNRGKVLVWVTDPDEIVEMEQNGY
ncbi:uncharacterized protein Z520_00282 [Fonsecaea multimorphosa CBS 102226]|uniref:Uncharacterized protein n=1 Tax=Fonsecaea multimorphosa CBS 102226 TaxID=1442371 RepID=A0A0D2HP34_9EURO|nr:uncharacterized protein Z520_00282 [Fonsecaea multimorphosa CBS 102226]KIY03591.1 hypothetical protein Z520_00282 [Fonsecaea multimorphosa CBS 102226]OAL32292.1 hypothetical protein AYO22_00314 [Fonsecaea multimorphosa]